MNRRTFLGTTALASTAGHAGKGATAGNKNRQNSNLILKGGYYRHHPVDFQHGTEGALGFKGWGETVDIEVPAKETALVPMHIWNIDFHPELPFSKDGSAGGVMEMLEWASRSASITKDVIPPILDAARRAGIRVVHVASDKGYAQNYIGFQKAVDIAGSEPSGLSRAPNHGETIPPDDRKQALLFGERFTEDIDFYTQRIDFPDPAKPIDSDYVVATTHQLNEVMRHHGIWNLIYIGFAINWCLWFSPCGMVDMSRLGYRCSCIEEAVTAVENRESVRGEFNKKQALWRTSLMFGYIHSARNFIDACSSIG